MVAVANVQLRLHHCAFADPGDVTHLDCCTGGRFGRGLVVTNASPAVMIKARSVVWTRTTTQSVRACTNSIAEIDEQKAD